MVGGQSILYVHNINRPFYLLRFLQWVGGWSKKGQYSVYVAIEFPPYHVVKKWGGHSMKPWHPWQRWPWDCIKLKVWVIKNRTDILLHTAKTNTPIAKLQSRWSNRFVSRIKMRYCLPKLLKNYQRYTRKCQNFGFQILTLS